MVAAHKRVWVGRPGKVFGRLPQHLARVAVQAVLTVTEFGALKALGEAFTVFLHAFGFRALAPTPGYPPSLLSNWRIFVILAPNAHAVLPAVLTLREALAIGLLALRFPAFASDFALSAFGVTEERVLMLRKLAVRGSGVALG